MHAVATLHRAGRVLYGCVRQALDLMEIPGLILARVWIGAPEEAGDTSAQGDGPVNLPVAGERPLLRRARAGRRGSTRAGWVGAWGHGRWGWGSIPRAYIARAPCKKVSCAPGRACPAFGLGK
jgi:hypothetical protein